MRGRHHAQAAVLLERAQRLEPGKGSIVEALARARYNSGQHPLAVDAFEELLAIDPSSAYGHYGLGQSLKQVGRTTRRARTCAWRARWRPSRPSTAPRSRACPDHPIHRSPTVISRRTLPLLLAAALLVTGCGLLPLRIPPTPSASPGAAASPTVAAATPSPTPDATPEPTADATTTQAHPPADARTSSPTQRPTPRPTPDAPPPSPRPSRPRSPRRPRSRPCP